MKIEQINFTEVNRVADLFNKYRVFYKQEPDIELAKNFIYEKLTNNESVVFLASVQKENINIPVGFTQLYPRNSSVFAVKNWHIGDLYIEKEYRRKGIAKQLMETAIDFAKSQNSKAISLNTAKDNFSAQQLYAALGFNQLERLPDFYYYEYSIPGK